MLKLFELDTKTNQLKFLMHGVNKTRAVPLNTWIEADQKMVTDGSNQTEYLSGFHFFLCDHNTIKTYCAKFTRPRKLVLVDVLVDNIRPKPTNPNIWLSGRMYVSNQSKYLDLGVL